MQALNFLDTNEWTDWQPMPLSGHAIVCGDCGFVHLLEFKLSDDGTLSFRAKCDVQTTDRLRSDYQFYCEPVDGV